MEKTGYYIYPTVPGSIYAFRWDVSGRSIKDVALNSSEVNRLGISEMTLNVTSVAAVDENNIEHTILRYKQQSTLKLYGIATGKNKRTKRMVKLAPGTYGKLRFYVNGKISYLHETREARGIFGMEYIEFDFEKPITVEAGEAPELRLRFNFLPFKRKSWFRSLSKPKPMQWPTAKWA